MNEIRIVVILSIMSRHIFRNHEHFLVPTHLLAHLRNLVQEGDCGSFVASEISAREYFIL